MYGPIDDKYKELMSKAGIEIEYFEWLTGFDRQTN